MPRVRELQEKIRELADRKGAIILAHNYQRAEVQQVADFVGESLSLAKKALEVEAELIVFCGVDFMAELTALLNPDKRVLMPEPASTCPMAAQLPASLVRKARRRYPDAEVVLYVNTLAEAKAEADVVCTSSNAVEVIRALEADRVLFGPDRNLCWHVSRHISGKEIIPIPEEGYCYVHKLFDPEEVLKLRRERWPNARLLVHPECEPELQMAADLVGSTGQMYRYMEKSSEREFLVATEVGLIERARREIPGKVVVPAKADAICAEMKLITLEKILRALEKEEPVVRVPAGIAERARQAVERMFEIMGVLRRAPALR